MNSKKRITERLPQSVIDSILDATDLESIIGESEHLVEVSGAKHCVCRFHKSRSDEKTLSIDRVEKRFNCSECGFKGSAIGWMQYALGMEFQDAIYELARRVNVDISEWIDDSGVEQARERQYALLNPVTQYYCEALENSPCEDYLLKRGVDKALQQRFALGYSPSETAPFMKTFAEHLRSLWHAGHLIRRKDGTFSGRFYNRLMFPIRNELGETLAYGARALSNASLPKYLNSTASRVFDKSSTLYGVYESVTAPFPADAMYLVEGYLDVIALDGVGIHHAVASLGTAVSADQINTIYGHTDTLYVCLDGDAAGRKATRSVLRTALPCMRKDEHLRFIVMPDGKDPDSLVKNLGVQAFDALVDASLNWNEFILQDASQCTFGDTTINIESRTVGQQAAFFDTVKSVASLIVCDEHRARINSDIQDIIGIPLF